jgi:DNA processing protein
MATDIRGLTLADVDYPPRLKEIHDPPDPLFVKGALPDPTRIHLAVVGSREPTRYGHEVVERLVKPVAASGVVIVSGLAYGIDGLAHKAALDAKGTTVAVLGAAIDDEQFCPALNRPLAMRMLAEGGALISEFATGSKIATYNFPKRNRVIAGLCHAVLIVEAANKSGSLITARCANEEGRDVYAVPGPITSALSEGPNRLIRSGATPITSADELMEALGMAHAEKPLAVKPVELSDPDEKAAHAAFGTEPMHVDELVRATKLSALRLNVALTSLELKGAIKHLGGRYYKKG